MIEDHRTAPAEGPGTRAPGGEAPKKHARPAPAPVPGSEADLRAPLPGPSTGAAGRPAAIAAPGGPTSPLADPATPAQGGGERPSDATLWSWLAAIPDPEIPAVSITDLGIVREIGWEGDRLTVTVTPTYTGCPATSVIAMQIEAALARRGVDARTRTRLSPPWTTDWIGPEAREKLRRYGISPPSPRGPEACPRCGSARTEMVSLFGSTPCKAQWRCLSCREPFDHFKCL